MFRKVDGAPRRLPERQSHPHGLDRTPTGITVFTASLALVPVAYLADRLPAGGDWRTAALAVFVAVVGLVTVDPLAALAMAGISLLLAIGLLRNRYGDLTWQGDADVVRGLLLEGGVLAGLLLGCGRSWWSGARPQPSWVATSNTVLTPTASVRSPAHLRGVEQQPLERNSHDG